MCLAIPMQVVEIVNDKIAVVSNNGVKARVDISLVKDVCLGDYLVIHAGFAIEKLDKEEADTRLELYREISLL